jgi:hypothetical protein
MCIPLLVEQVRRIRGHLIEFAVQVVQPPSFFPAQEQSSSRHSAAQNRENGLTHRNRATA